MTDFRVEKLRTEVTLSLTNGTNVRGVVFRSHSSATRGGPERIKDILNSGGQFFPFEIGQPERRTVLYNRDHVVLVTLVNDAELREDPGYEVALSKAVSMLLSNGERLTGFVRVQQPHGRERLSDHASAGERFQYLEAPNGALIVNVHHIVELTETDHP